jgi:hypothetical protein
MRKSIGTQVDASRALRATLKERLPRECRLGAGGDVTVTLARDTLELIAEALFARSEEIAKQSRKLRRRGPTIYDGPTRDALEQDHADQLADLATAQVATEALGEIMQRFASVPRGFATVNADEIPAGKFVVDLMAENTEQGLVLVAEGADPTGWEA